jgi:hypothetical protein
MWCGGKFKGESTIKVESFGLSNRSRYVAIVLIDENRENGKITQNLKI